MELKTYSTGDTTFQWNLEFRKFSREDGVALVALAACWATLGTTPFALHLLVGLVAVGWLIQVPIRGSFALRCLAAIVQFIVSAKVWYCQTTWAIAIVLAYRIVLPCLLYLVLACAIDGADFVDGTYEGVAQLVAYVPFTQVCLSFAKQRKEWNYNFSHRTVKRHN